MKLFKSALLMTVIALTRVLVPQSSAASEANQDEDTSEVESDVELDSVLKNVSPSTFEDLNFKDHDMSFRE